MTSHEAFLQAITEDPDDDTPRLVYADWMEEHGQPERAELIRVQCRLAQTPSDDPERPTLLERERVLLTEHEAAWVEPLRPLLLECELPSDECCPPLLGHPWQFRRGFVERVALRVETFLEHADRLFRLAPVRAVWFAFDQEEGEDVNGEDHARLAGSPFLARLTTLDLSGHVFDHPLEGTHALLTSPHLAGLRSLYLRYGFGLDDTGFLDGKTLRLLGSGKYLTHLEYLDLSLNEFVTEDLASFRRAKGFRSLRSLCLRGVYMNGFGARSVTNAPCLANLQELDLSLNDIGDLGARALAASPYLAQLRRLVVSSAPVTEEPRHRMTEAGREILRARFGSAVVFVDRFASRVRADNEKVRLALEGQSGEMAPEGGTHADTRRHPAYQAGAH
jgi:uncharacterized protein (TIGR02996 family)